MAVVYRAKDLLIEQFGEPVPFIAVKVVSDALAQSADASALLYNEFALTQCLRHDNIVRVQTFDVDKDCQRAFITMELMHGPTLDKLLCEYPVGLPWRQLRAVALPLLHALAYIHRQGVLHGDIKPSNIMLSDEGVRLFDFGLGLAQGSVLAGLPHVSRDRIHAWTPGYAAPEVLTGQPLSAKADIYSAACVIYELAEGKRPYPRHTAAEELGQNQPEPRRPKHLPLRCWPALRRALAPDPAQRTVTALQLHCALSAPTWHLKGYWR